MRRTEGRRLARAPLFLRGQEIPYVLDTWDSVTIGLTIAFQPPPVASLRPQLKVPVWRASISAYLAITQDIRNQRITCSFRQPMDKLMKKMTKSQKLAKVHGRVRA